VSRKKGFDLFPSRPNLPISGESREENGARAPLGVNALFDYVNNLTTSLIYLQILFLEITVLNFTIK